ncbi:hypothetical protein EZS27_013257 [termite gut metagenome]|uniref:ISXO2-like transposase domain-containing protein n=1 Tax=termite gut metagenome TaxID=433724 RepID=A0A5J4RYU1_9ZZZZ
MDTKNSIGNKINQVIIGGETTKNGKSRKVEHIKMIVIKDLKSATITPLVRENTSQESSIDSDHSTSYVQLKNIVKEHRPKVIPKKKQE